ncbi:hypothetical protein NDU88_003944 [Pleurodeles waltl]|uniref:Uncharacterized protein n=1 Tax=Pleurodeles waltl TaxID=8319 RepID=A0AAV7NI61_PLEWA|nr:hypothetical protein NDU88_003944 [Pleurodeles waltl]
MAVDTLGQGSSALQRQWCFEQYKQASPPVPTDAGQQRRMSLPGDHVARAPFDEARPLKRGAEGGRYPRLVAKLLCHVKLMCIAFTTHM